MGPDSGIIVPSAWETTIEPDMKITMHMWPLPEPKEEPMPPPPDGMDGILNLDDLLGPEKEVKGRGKTSNLFLICKYLSTHADNVSLTGSKAPKKASRPSTFGSWMLGSSKPRGKSLKGEKRPDVAAGDQHPAGNDQNPCSVM